MRCRNSLHGPQRQHQHGKLQLDNCYVIHSCLRTYYLDWWPERPLILVQTPVSSTISAVKIQLLSDLHLESNPHFTATPTRGADVLVLAGDIGSYQAGSQLTALNIPDFGLGLPAFVTNPCPRGQGFLLTQ